MITIRSKKLLAASFAVFSSFALLIVLGTHVFYDRRYLIISCAMAIVSCAVFFYSFEKRQKNARRFVLLASMTALSVAGRSLFAPIPFFKPVTAVVIICGVYMGCREGFICGSMSAFLSNFIFMHGPWTPFQMFIWGLIGFLAGLCSKPLKRSRALLIVFAIMSGVLYSAFMDIWTAVWWDGTFLTGRYLAALIAALPVTAVYAVSNVVFLLLLFNPIGRKIERIDKKYGL